MSSQGQMSATALEVLLVLFGIIALILACAWGVRRLGVVGAGGRGGQLKVLAAMPVGARERIALIEAEGVRLLVGITPQSIRTLHVFDGTVRATDCADDGADNESPDTAPSEFASRLQAIIKGKISHSRRSSEQGGEQE